RSTSRRLACLGLSLAAICGATSAHAEQPPGPAPLPPASLPPVPATQAPPQLLAAPVATDAQPYYGPASQPGAGAQPAPSAPAAGQPVTARPPGDNVGEAEQNPRKRGGVVPVLRAGFMLAGAGQIREECDGELCSSSGASTADYTDASGPAVIGGDLLFHIGPDFRLGPGALYLPKTSWDMDGASSGYEAGSELALLLVGEGVFDLSSKVALSV